MGVSREIHNLLFYLKKKDYKRFWYFLRHYDKTTHEDTWMPIVCKYRGHKYYQPDKENEPEEWACKRCHKFLQWSETKNKKLTLNKKLKKLK